MRVQNEVVAILDKLLRMKEINVTNYKNILFYNKCMYTIKDIDCKDITLVVEYLILLLT